VVKGATTKASHTGTGAQLVVYADDSLIRSDLDARQEFLKMKLNGQGEHVETFKILPSRFEMKARHPFRRAEEDGAVERAARASREETPRTPLSPEEEAALEASVGAVESPTVRRALERAIRADKNRI
ncbi:MAG: phosphoadenosine phosphosulfate sulfotransferase, partial [Eggerthella lenta]